MKKRISLLVMFFVLFTLILVACNSSNSVNNIKLGKELIKSKLGGFSYKVPEDFIANSETGGGVILFAQGGDSTKGPMMWIFGSPVDEGSTNEDLLSGMQQFFPSFKSSDPKTIKVNGKKGLDVSLTSNDGSDLTGRLVVVMVSSSQEFTMMGIASKDKWAATNDVFDAVLGSIKFSEFVKTTDSEDLLKNKSAAESDPNSSVQEGSQVDVTCVATDSTQENKPTLDYFNIEKGKITIKGGVVTVTMYLKENPPEKLEVNVSGTPGNTENMWGVYIDVDGNPKTGSSQRTTSDYRSAEAPGIEDWLQVQNYTRNDEPKTEVVFADYFKSQLLEFVNGTGTPVSTSPITVNRQDKSITFSAVMPKVTDRSKFYFVTYCPMNCTDDANNDSMFGVVCTRNK